MADPALAKALVRGAYDMHIHSAPDIIPRKADDLDLARRAAEAGMAGLVLKNHFAPTAGRAAQVQGLVPGIRVFGGIALNHTVGGLNALAVDVAGRMGAKVVWLPTVDSANEATNVAGRADESKLPYWMAIVRDMHAKGMARDPIRVIDADRHVTKETMQVLEAVAAHDMVLATGHVGFAEILAVAEAATRAHVERIVVTHVEFPTINLSVEQQKRLERYGVFFERCFVQAFAGRAQWETYFRNIREVGPETTILSTDVGQTTSPEEPDALAMYMGQLLDAGFTEPQIRRMSHRNPAQVMGLTP